MITAILLTLSMLSLMAALVAFAALLTTKRAGEPWSKCPECQWHHRGYEFELHLPPNAHIASPRQCACCATIRRIEARQKFTRSAR